MIYGWFKGKPPLRSPVGFQFRNEHKIPDFKISTLNKGEIFMHQFLGKKIILVNVASKCGYTPQYYDLEKMYLKNKDRLTIIAFPSNEFGEQEPGSNAEIKEFCSSNFSISFPISEKVIVKGENKCDLYTWLTDPSKNGWNSKEPQWNFCKYLIDEKGFLAGFYYSGQIKLKIEN